MMSPRHSEVKEQHKVSPSLIRGSFPPCQCACSPLLPAAGDGSAVLPLINTGKVTDPDEKGVRGLSSGATKTSGVLKAESVLFNCRSSHL